MRVPDASGPARSGSRGLSRWLYYLSSIPTILLQMRSPWKIVALFLGLPVRRPLTVRLPGGLRFAVRSRMDIWILKESCLDRDYERGAVAVRDGWTVFDVGAGFGDFTVRVARECPHSRVFAFEPLPESFARLEEHVRENGAGNVRAFAQAVGGGEAEQTLYTVTGLSGQHRTAGDASRGGSEQVRVPATTLSRAMAENGVARCDFLKIDCEGAEYEILLGADEETLARVEHIAIEYHDAITSHDHRELVRFLEQRGFDVRTRPSPAWHELGFLFASRTARAAADNI